jgi:tRNA-dihydrouridine synthase B
METDQKLSALKAGDTALRLGNIVFPGRAWLAPMSGITDVGLRRAAMHFGAGAVVSEMVASEAYVVGSAEARLRAEGEGVFPHIVQLAGCRAEGMADAAKLAEAAGADIIDINMGCPAKKVTGGWAGSALMRDLDHATTLIAATVAAVKVPVTVKMRLGWDDTSLVAPELARRAHDLGVGLVTVHGRTRQQFYKGKANWAAIADVRATFPGILVANGDINTISDAHTCRATSGADAVMIGRAAVGRPWLVGEISAGLDGREWSSPSPMERAQAAIGHYETLLSLYGPELGIRHARKHLAAFADDAAAIGGGLEPTERHELVTSTAPARVISLLSGMYANVALGVAA